MAVEALLSTGSSRGYAYPLDKYLGEVPAKLFIFGSVLADKLGLTAGTLFNDDGGWLKFSTQEGLTLFVAKKPFRYKLSWNQLNAAKAIFGETKVLLGGKYYRIRLLKGAEDDPTKWAVALGQDNPPIVFPSEWNRFIHRVCSSNPGPGRTLEQFSLADLGIAGTFNGRMTMTQETLGSNSGMNIARGNRSLGEFNYVNKVDGAATGKEHHGWRPVLEEMGDGPTFPDSGPGSKALLYGDEQLGYFGEVSGDELFRPVDFLNRVNIAGISAVLDNNGATKVWLKFFFKGKVIYIAKKPFAASLTWENAYRAGMVYGTDDNGVYPVAGSPTNQYRPMFKKDGNKTFALVPRLIHGVNKDGYTTLDNSAYSGSEWTELLGRTADVANAPVTEKWDAFPFTDINGSGYQYTLAMETLGSNTAYAVFMSNPANMNTLFTHHDNVPKTQANLYYRPVLELNTNFDGIIPVENVSVNGPKIANFAAAANKGKLYVFGGQLSGPTDNKAYSRFDAETNAWTNYGGISWSWSGGVFCGDVFWTTGGTDGSYKNNLYQISPTTGALSAATAFPALPGVVRGQVKMAAISDTVFHVVGGYDPSLKKTSALHYRFDTAAKTWTQLADLPVSMNGHGAGCYKGKLYVGGGWNETLESMSDIREYDPSTDKWVTVGNAPKTTSWVGGTVYKNLFVLGGVESGKLILHLFDLDRKVWGRVQTQIPGRYAGEFVADDTGLYIIGGSSVAVGAGTYNTALRYGDVYRFDTFGKTVEELTTKLPTVAVSNLTGAAMGLMPLAIREVPQSESKTAVTAVKDLRLEGQKSALVTVNYSISPDTARRPVSLRAVDDADANWDSFTITGAQTE